MRYNKTMAEILDDVSKAGTRELKVRILKENNSNALRTVIRFILDKDIKFDTETPVYEPDKAPLGLSLSNLYIESRRLYLFTERTNLPARKKQKLLKQMLESVSPIEAKLIEMTINKDASVLPETSIIVEAIPELIDEGWIQK